MRIEVPPISAGPSQDPTNPGIEKEAPAENSPFYPLVMERIEDLHSGRLAGKGRKELRESDSAGGESREDREAVPKSSVSDPAWHWQDFAACTARTEPANAVLPTEDLLPTGGNEESQSTDDRPAVTGTSAEMVGDLWVGEEFTSCTQWIAAAPQLPRTALPKTEPMDPAGVSAGKPSARRPERFKAGWDLLGTSEYRRMRRPVEERGSRQKQCHRYPAPCRRMDPPLPRAGFRRTSDKRPAPTAQLPDAPQRPQTKPSGHRSRVRYSRHASSVANRSSNSITVFG